MIKITKTLNLLFISSFFITSALANTVKDISYCSGTDTSGKITITIDTNGDSHIGNRVFTTSFVLTTSNILLKQCSDVTAEFKAPEDFSMTSYQSIMDELTMKGLKVSVKYYED